MFSLKIPLAPAGGIFSEQLGTKGKASRAGALQGGSSRWKRGGFTTQGLIFEDYIVRCDLPEQAMTLQAQEVSQVRWASPQEIRALFDGGEFIYQESELQKVLDYARESLRESGLPGGEKAKLPD